MKYNLGEDIHTKGELLKITVDETTKINMVSKKHGQYWPKLRWGRCLEKDLGWVDRFPVTSASVSLSILVATLSRCKLIVGLKFHKTVSLDHWK